MGSGSSVPSHQATDQPLVSDEQTLTHLEEGVALVSLLTPPKNKFFRTLHCHFRHEEFDSVAKVCYVRDVDLSFYHQRLNIQKQVLTQQHAPNVLTNHRFRYGVSRSPTHSSDGHSSPPLPSEDASSPTFLIRQYLFANLKDRLATRPFLGEAEKLWIAYSLLCAVQQLHSCGICHGDIKTENVLLTSWGWTVLTDMAPYKPTFLEADQAAAPFNFFFSTGKKRCYLAPERFVKWSSNREANGEELDPSMDLFALGMVLLELFNVDGTGESVFELSDALEYSASGASGRLEELLIKVNHPAVRKICQSLTRRNPLERTSIADCLLLFPSEFGTFLYPLMHSMLDSQEGEQQEDVLVWKTCEAYPNILRQLNVRDEHGSKLCSTLLRTKRLFYTSTTAAPTSTENAVGEVHPEEEEEFRKVKEIIHKMERTLQNHQSTAQLLGEEEEREEEEDSHPLPPDNVLIVLISYLGVCVLKAAKEQTRVVAMLLLTRFALLTRSDELTLSRVLPFVAHRVSKDNEPSVLVRCLALDSLVELLDSLYSTVPYAEQKYFPDYLLPLLKRCAKDPSESVRVGFATHLAAIASHAKMFLELSRQAISTTTPANYDTELNVLRDFVQRAMEKLTGGENGNGTALVLAIKSALVSHMLSLCLFFGRDRIETWLLPWLLSVFNVWQLQVQVLNSLGAVGAFVGSEAFNMFLFPLLDDMLYSTQDLVVEAAANALATLVSNQLIAPKGKLFKLVENIAPLLRHPSMRARRACLRVLASVFTLVEHVDAQLFLMEHVQPHFAPPVHHVDVFLLLGRQGMTWNQTMALLDSLQLLPSFTSLQKWSKEYNKPYTHHHQPNITATAAATATTMHARLGEGGDQQYPIHRLTVDESLGGREGASAGRPMHLTTLMAKHGLVDVPAGVSGEALFARVRALQLPELKYNLGWQSAPPLQDDAHVVRKEWRIRGNLVTPLLEHTGPVRRIQVSEDSSFFTTGSDDGTVKLWVCNKLDRNPCPKSKMTFTLGSRVVDLCSIRHTSSFATASANGQVSLIRSDGPAEAFKHGQINSPASPELDSSLVALVVPDGSNHLVAATERGAMYQWDLRSGTRLLDSVLLTPGFGSVSCMATSLDGTWLVLGTHRGVVAVVDLRFNMMLCAWRHPYSNPVYRLHVSKATQGKPLVFACVGRNQTVLLNVETGETKLALSCALPEVSVDSDTQHTWKQSQERLFSTKFERIELDSRQSVDKYIREAQMVYSNSLQHHSMRAVLVPGDVIGNATGGGLEVPTSVLTAGTDMTVRYWDVQSAQGSSLVTAPLDEQKPRWEAKRTTASTMLLCYSGQKLAPPQAKTTTRFVVRTSHFDAILDLGAVKMRDSRFLLVTSGRDGAVKLWQ
ncbi:hypothetical protein BASA81_000933 [Batrachochytrium salamandrivorans]|nr:hypothetical protein BASA81_000933 [Batrachochytrium salamandrivorans]